MGYHYIIYGIFFHRPNKILEQRKGRLCDIKTPTQNQLFHMLFHMGETFNKTS